jgi:hypothetical protein
MPNYVASRAQNLLNDHKQAINGSTVLMLGVTYKPNIADSRESPATPLAKRLQQLGAVHMLVRTLVFNRRIVGLCVARCRGAHQRSDEPMRCAHSLQKLLLCHGSSTTGRTTPRSHGHASPELKGVAR